MIDIYKINQVINNKVKKIFVFIGPYEIKKSSSGPTIKGNDIFSKSEWKNITKEKIPIIYISKYIHGDDTILRIKEKILKECPNVMAATSEMYIFSIIMLK